MDCLCCAIARVLGNKIGVLNNVSLAMISAVTLQGLFQRADSAFTAANAKCSGHN